MNNTDKEIFIQLYKDAFTKCFGFNLQKALSETESKHFSNKIFGATGLVVGAKSIKNYSIFITNREARSENPSVATLDTLARYVFNAPFTDETHRKREAGDYPYWFKYKASVTETTEPETISVQHKKHIPYVIISVIAVLFIIVAIWQLQLLIDHHKNFTEAFSNVSEDSLLKDGWMIENKDANWWNKRGNNLPGLTLYTLSGDNWPDSVNKPGIKNLLIRKIDKDCFSAEIHLENFVPQSDWQQAGILLMEDTGFTKKSVRLSIAYNDFFGGFNKPKEIILQGLVSGGKDASTPEEIAHIPLFTFAEKPDSLVSNNMHYTALRIEKNKDEYRFLYTASPVENFALKEAFVKNINIRPKYIGVFALQGFVDDSNYIPAHITYFNLVQNKCD